MQSAPFYYSWTSVHLVAEPRETNTSLEGCLQAGKPRTGPLGCLSPFHMLYAAFNGGVLGLRFFTYCSSTECQGAPSQASLCTDHRPFSTPCLSRTWHLLHSSPNHAFHTFPSSLCSLSLGTWTRGVSSNHDTTWTL